MKKVIRAASLVNTFLKYHEDADNYHDNSAGFEKMYKILDKYDTSNGNDSVEVAFNKATPEDQHKMVELITPKPKFGTLEYCRSMYYNALECDIENATSEYCNGVVDAIEALFSAGIVDEKEFRTDL